VKSQLMLIIIFLVPEILKSLDSGKLYTYPPRDGRLSWPGWLVT